MSVVDLHSDMQLDLARPGQSPAETYTDKHLPGMLRGEVAVRILATLSPPPDPTTAAFRNLAATRAAGCNVVTELKEVKDAEPQYVLGLEGAEPFGEDIHLVEALKGGKRVSNSGRPRIDVVETAQDGTGGDVSLA